MDPIVEIQKGKQGAPFLTLSGRSIESRYAPEKEGEKRAQKIVEKGGELCLLLGGGLGYLPAALKRAFSGKVWVYDPFGTFEGADLKTPEDLEEALTGFEGQSVRIETHPGYEPFLRFEKALANSTLRKRMGSPLLKPIFSQRALEVAPYLSSCPPVSLFHQAFSNHRAYLAAPGPSLEKSLPELKKGDGVVFAALQAVPLLEREGIEIDFLVIPDPGEMEPYLKACKGTQKVVLSDVHVAPEVFKWAGEKGVLFQIFSEQVSRLLWEKMGERVIDEPFATVSEVMLHLASYMGFSEIVLCGMDYCWTNERYSIRAKGAHDPFLDGTEVRFDLDTGGQVVKTESIYYHGARYTNWKVSKIKKGGAALFSLSEGIPFEGCLPYQAGKGTKPKVAIPSFKGETKEQIDKWLKEAFARRKRPSGNVGIFGNVAKRMPFLDPLEIESLACARQIEGD